MIRLQSQVMNRATWITSSMFGAVIALNLKFLAALTIDIARTPIPENDPF